MKLLPVVLRSVIGGIVTILANYFLVVHYKLGYFGWFVGGFIGTFIVNGSYWYDVNFKLGLMPIYKFKKKTIIKYLKIAMPTIPHFYSGYMMNTSSKMVMDVQGVSLGVIGQSNIVLQIGNLMTAWVEAINQAINPMAMNEIRNNDEEKAKRLIYIYYFITFACTFIFSVWSREIFTLLISNDELGLTLGHFFR